MDKDNVYIAFDEAQRDLRMSATESSAARCSEVEIKAKPGADLDHLKKEVLAVTAQVEKRSSSAIVLQVPGSRPGSSSRNVYPGSEK